MEGILVPSQIRMGVEDLAAFRADELDQGRRGNLEREKKQSGFSKH